MRVSRLLFLGLVGCFGENDSSLTADVTVPADVQADLADSFPVVVAVYEEFSASTGEDYPQVQGALCAVSADTAVLHLSESGIGSCSEPDAFVARILKLDVDPAECVDEDPYPGETTEPIDGAPEVRVDSGYACDFQGQSSSISVQVDF